MGAARRERRMIAAQARAAELLAEKQRYDQGSGLLRLPAEWRNNIYEYVCEGFQAFPIDKHGKVHHSAHVRTCRQLRSEVLSLYEVDNSDTTEVVCDVHNFDFKPLSTTLKRFSIEAKQAITEGKKLRIRLTFDDKLNPERAAPSLRRWISMCQDGKIPETHGMYSLPDLNSDENKILDIGRVLRARACGGKGYSEGQRIKHHFRCVLEEKKQGADFRMRWTIDRALA